MRVRFDTVEDFLEELGLAVEAPPAAMTPPILRFSCTYTPMQGQVLRTTVVAGVLIHRQLIEWVPHTQVWLWVYGEQCTTADTVGVPAKSRRSAMGFSIPRGLPRRKARLSRSLPRSHWCCITLRLDGGRHASPSLRSNECCSSWCIRDQIRLSAHWCNGGLDSVG
jgi:hypothetical protein